MLGICMLCGKPAKLRCKVCGAVVCENCILSYGCKLCKGRKIVGEKR